MKNLHRLSRLSGRSWSVDMSSDARPAALMVRGSHWLGAQVIDRRNLLNGCDLDAEWSARRARVSNQNSPPGLTEPQLDPRVRHWNMFIWPDDSMGGPTGRADVRSLCTNDQWLGSRAIVVRLVAGRWPREAGAGLGDVASCCVNGSKLNRTEQRDATGFSSGREN